MKVTLKALRVNLGLTQYEMARLIGVSEATWYNYENYKTFPDVPVINKITEETGVDYNDINFLPPNYGLNVKTKNQSA